MNEIHSYSKVWALGHPQLEGLTDESVVVQEKLDGSQFSFMRGCKYNGVDNDTWLSFRSKGAIIHEAAPGMFKSCVEAVRALSTNLTANYLYRAEFHSRPRHNTLQYDRVPKHFLVVYDIEDMNQGPYHFLRWQDVAKECERIGFEYVLPDDIAVVQSMADLESHMAKPSMLGGAREGVVLKNYRRFTKDGKVMMGKYVSERFKEVHAGAWKAANPTGTDIIESLIRALATETRYEKAVQHLREAGRLQHSVQDIGLLIREVQTDVIAEEADRIAKALFTWAKPRIERGVGRAIPMWWKKRLAKEQFGESD